MAGSDDLSTLSVGEYLLSIADGVVHAQQHLGLSRIATGDGQHAVIYQIPRLDFELKISLKLSRTDGQAGAVGPGGIIAPLLKVQPAAVQPGAERSAQSGAVSTIKGSFVAVPVEGGRPPPVVSIALKEAGYELTITVALRTVSNEPVAGAEAEFNIDREESARLRRAAGLPGDAPGDDTFLTAAVQLTDGAGTATTTLRVGEKEPKGHVVVVIDVAGRTETLVWRGPRASAK